MNMGFIKIIDVLIFIISFKIIIVHNLDANGMCDL